MKHLTLKSKYKIDVHRHKVFLKIQITYQVSESYHTVVQVCQGFYLKVPDILSKFVEVQWLQNRWHKLLPVGSRERVSISYHLSSVLKAELNYMKTL